MKSTTNYLIKRALAIVLFFSISNILLAQPSIQWQKCYGGTSLENSYSSLATSDGGFVVIGETKSSDGNVSGHHASPNGNYGQDVWIVKTNSSGNIDWEKSYGGSSLDVGQAIKQTSDGGYIFAGTTLSTDGDVSGSHGSYDVWLVKLDSNGNIQWQKCLGGSSDDWGRALELTADGGYILAGATRSSDGDVSGIHGTQWADIWTVKLDSLGTIQWQKCLGGTSQDGHVGITFTGSNFNRMSIIQTSDGGYFVGSCSMSVDGDVTGHHGPGGLVMIGLVSHWDADYWLVKLDNVGTIEWQKSIGGTDEEYVYSVTQASDGGCVIAGSTRSTDGDIVGQIGAGYHSWIVKLDVLGNIQWKKFIGTGTSQSWPYSISKTTDNGYFIAGKLGSDFWACKLDASGNLLWQKLLGGTAVENGTAGFETSDGGYFISGHSLSNNADVSGNHGGGDYWMVKLLPVPTNIINGTIYEDLNANCLKDSNEVGLFGQIVRAMPGNYYATTDLNGNYTLFVDTGSYVVSHTPPVIYNQSCPPVSGVYNVTINALNPNSINNNFADTLTIHCTDVKVSIASPFLRLCRKNNYSIMYKNVGSLPATNVSISLELDSAVIPISSNIPWVFANNQYTFAIGTLPAGQMGAVILLDSVSCAANVGDVLCANAKIVTNDVECDTLNNIDNDCHPIVASCDPNELEVQSQIPNAGYVQQENISASDTLSYIIHFQNTGTDTAYTVVVRDTLSEYLDCSTIESGASSHAYSFRVYENGICEWTFNDILLPDSSASEINSHGFVKFNVRQTASNIEGTLIENSSSIWFDYNLPLATNTTNNLIPFAVGLESQVLSDDLSSVIAYPNPSNGLFKVKGLLLNDRIEVYNTLGNLLRIDAVKDDELVLDLSEFSIGVYILKVKSSKGDLMIKIMKHL
jgi:uncharacterized repeat protein (TIGR01451 family)